MRMSSVYTEADKIVYKSRTSELSLRFTCKSCRSVKCITGAGNIHISRNLASERNSLGDNRVCTLPLHCDGTSRARIHYCPSIRRCASKKLLTSAPLRPLRCFNVLLRFWKLALLISKFLTVVYRFHRTRARFRSLQLIINKYKVCLIQF